VVRSSNDTVIQLILERCPAPSGLLSDQGSSPLRASFPQHAFSSGRLLLPVQLYLANQVLLI
jgi:hypothetical protein